MEDRNFLGGIFDKDCTLLWFIILFLLLFWHPFNRFDFGTGVAVRE